MIIQFFFFLGQPLEELKKIRICHHHFKILTNTNHRITMYDSTVLPTFDCECHKIKVNTAVATNTQTGPKRKVESAFLKITKHKSSTYTYEDRVRLLEAKEKEVEEQHQQLEATKKEFLDSLLKLRAYEQQMATENRELAASKKILEAGVQAADIRIQELDTANKEANEKVKQLIMKNATLGLEKEKYKSRLEKIEVKLRKTQERFYKSNRVMAKEQAKKVRDQLKRERNENRIKAKEEAKKAREQLRKERRENKKTKGTRVKVVLKTNLTKNRN